MITGLNSSAESFIADVARIQNRIAEANRVLSSGLRISTAADAPDQISPLLELRANLGHNQQIVQGLDSAKTEAQTAESTLDDALQLMDRVRTLASQGASSSQTPTMRAQLAVEVQSIQQQIVGLANTTLAGRYIFSGQQSSSPAYTYDPSAPNGVVQVATSGVTAQVGISSGGSFTVAKTATDIFDTRDATDPSKPASDNVFAALAALNAALVSTDSATDINQIASASELIEQASNHVIQMQAFYGDVQARIQDATDVADHRITQIQARISEIEDGDAVSAATEMSQANSQLQAAFAARAQFRQRSLFDYLS